MSHPDDPVTTGPVTTTEFDSPPLVIIRAGDLELSLDAFTACFGNVCFDGFAPDPLPDIGSPDEIVVEFPLEEWEFTAEVIPLGEDCGPRILHPLERVGQTTHRLVPVGRAGTHQVTLFGRSTGGDVGGDLLVAFQWTTTDDGILPEPKATASVLADHDGRIDSYGVEISLSNLSTTPETVTGQVTVMSADGASHSFDLTVGDVVCSEGSLYLTAPQSEGLTAAGLGSAPFVYTVALTLDGQTHVGSATWPDDVDLECDPCVPLVFDPPLPGMG